MQLLLGEHELSIDLDVEDTASTSDQRGPNVERLGKLGGQTGRLGLVVSNYAVFDRDLHRVDQRSTGGGAQVDDVMTKTDSDGHVRDIIMGGVSLDRALAPTTSLSAAALGASKSVVAQRAHIIVADSDRGGGTQLHLQGDVLNTASERPTVHVAFAVPVLVHGRIW